MDYTLKVLQQISFSPVWVTPSLCLYKVSLRGTMRRHRFGVLKDWCVPGKGTECLPAVPATPRSLLRLGLPVVLGCLEGVMSLLQACCRASAVLFACASPTSASLCSLKDEVVLVLPSQSPSQLDFNLCQ